MQKYMKTMIGMAAVAALSVVVITTSAPYASAQAAAATPPAAGKKAKAVKDTNEYDIYNEVIKDSQANPPAPKKFLADLDSWAQKYPDSDYKDYRSMYYVQAYAASNETGKSMDAAKVLVDKGIDGLKDGLDDPGLVLGILFTISRVSTAQAATGTPTPEQLATGAKAASLLAEFGNGYFAKDKKPAARTDDEWAQGLKQVQDQAKLTLFQIALYPGASTYKKNTKDPANCAVAEEAFKKTLQDYPDSGQATAQLAAASLCQQAVNPAKAQQALYLYARAVSLPAGGISGLDAANQKTYDDYLKRIYTAYHGSDEGLAELKALAAKSPAPPADFHVKTAREIATAAEEEFRTKNPQLAVWMGIKGSLADTDGQKYFDDNMKEHDLSGANGAKLLKGKLLEGKPSCRSKELLVAIPLPSATGNPVAEITLKLETPLTGKPETGVEIQFNGAPTAFTKEPFMLTMESDKTKIDGLIMTPCVGGPARKGPAVAPKKKG